MKVADVFTLVAIVYGTSSNVLAISMVERSTNTLEASKKPGCGAMSMMSAKSLRMSAKISKLYRKKAAIPGAGMEPSALAPFANSYMDGFSMVSCVKDDMHLSGDKFGDGKYSYKLGDVSNVSIVHYTEIVAKEDSEAMTLEVCFAFCRSIPDMLFFGLTNGRDCYCTPYFSQIAGDSSDCDAVCDGDPTTMCGGKTKSSIFEMHSCNDASANLQGASDSAKEERLKLVDILASVAASGESMQSAAATLQKSFGKVGDSAATTHFQAAKVFAGTLEHAAEDGVKLATQIEDLEKDAASSTGPDATMESLTAELKEATESAKSAVANLDSLQANATEPEIGLNTSAELYYSVMYFVDKEFVDVPSTCGGKPTKDPLIASYAGCAAACEVAVTTCVGFSYFAKASLCFLLSELDTVTYYTGCGGGAFLEARAKLGAANETKCAVKFNKFEGEDLTPDPSGKCDGCLKKASKADRCFE